jgi:hypothetical protein
MAIIFPRTDILDLARVVSVQFWPVLRQELSRTAGGATQGKDMGPPLWRASFTTAPALHADLGALEAALLSLGGVSRSFTAYDVRNPFPAAHRDGIFNDTGRIGALGSDNKSLSLANLAEGISLRPGDYLSFDYGAPQSRALHRVLEAATAGADGATGLFEVVPHIEPGAAVGAAVSLKRPSCLMILNPDQPPPSIQAFVASSVSFSAIQII